jgi:carboxyl-terminal processing protease
MFTSKRFTNVLLILSIAVIIFGSGYKLGEYRTAQGKIDQGSYNIINAKTDQKVSNIDFSLFWDTWNTVEQKFIDKKKLDTKKMFYGAIKGMVASLNDPYTFFLTPDENKQSKDDLNGKFEGIGAQLGLKDNQIVVIAPLKNSPAEIAGVKAGDSIVKVGDESTKGWTLTQAVSKIRGPKGTEVKITVMRNNKEIPFTLKRDVINISSVELSYETKETIKTNQASATLPQGNSPVVAYLRLSQFGSNTNEEWDRAIDEIKSHWDRKEIKGMVLDLRDNPGGYLESAVYLGSEFLPRDSVIVKQETTSASFENREYRSTRDGRLKDIPLTILINQGSASASEILAGALRDYKRATLIGEKSFGKGSVQEALNLKDDAGLHVTVAKWILPKGDWINGKGIEPNIKIDNVVADGNTLTRATDLQLEKAVEVVLK